MPSYTVRNNNYRDEVETVPYPFDVLFNGDLGTVSIGFGTVIDACFFFRSDVDLPIHVSAVDGLYGTDEEVLLVISDNGNNKVAEAVITKNMEYCNVQDVKGNKAGIITWNAALTEDVITQAKGQYIETLPEESTFSIDVCKIMSSARPDFISVNGKVATGDVNIVARHGVRWTEGDGKLQLDIVGDIPEEGTAGNPVLSVNGIANKTIWLNTAPESNFRIDTNANALLFGQAKDITS